MIIPNSTNLTYEDDSVPPSLFCPVEQGVIATIWVLLALSAYVLSALIFVVVYRLSAYHTPGYYLLVSLSISDLLTLTFYITVGLPLSLIYPETRVSRHVRDIIGTLKVITYSASVYLIFFIGANRYISVCHFTRYKQIFTTNVTRALVAVSWLGGVVNAIILHLSSRYYWDAAQFGFLFDATLPTTIYFLRINQAIALLMLIVGTFFYGSVLMKVKKSGTVRSSTVSSSSPSQREFALSMQFMVVTVVFILCWLVLTI